MLSVLILSFAHNIIYLYALVCIFYAIRRKRLYFPLALLRVRSQTNHKAKFFIAAYFTETMPQIGNHAAN